jgi:hypothetical protein
MYFLEGNTRAVVSASTFQSSHTKRGKQFDKKRPSVNKE